MWHWNKFLSEFFRFSPVNIIPPWFHTHNHLGDEQCTRWRPLSGTQSHSIDTNNITQTMTNRNTTVHMAVKWRLSPTKSFEFRKNSPYTNITRFLTFSPHFTAMSTAVLQRPPLELYHFLLQNTPTRTLNITRKIYYDSWFAQTCCDEQQ
jgi:hypothetical protein